MPVNHKKPDYEGTSSLILKLIYDGGLLVNEGCRLRIKDIDFDQQLINVRDGKEGKDRTALLPATLTAGVQDHIARVIDRYQEIQELLGHAKVETTMIYTNVIKDMHSPEASPLDVLGRRRVLGRFLKNEEVCGWEISGALRALRATRPAVHPGCCPAG